MIDRESPDVDGRMRSKLIQQCLKIGFSGFVIALVGAATGFVGIYLEQQYLLLAGFAITVVGVVTGFVGVIRGWFSLRNLK